tara:strand:- start:1772 stop:1915 length:144 start_codon:yes stop_codon:yes gene_type:complete
MNSKWENYLSDDFNGLTKPNRTKKKKKDREKKKKQKLNEKNYGDFQG